LVTSAFRDAEQTCSHFMVLLDDRHSLKESIESKNKFKVKNELIADNMSNFILPEYSERLSCYDCNTILFFVLIDLF